MSSEAGGQLDELKLEDEVQPASDQGSQGGDSDPETSDDELVALTPGATSVAWSVIEDADLDIGGDVEEEGYVLTSAAPSDSTEIRTFVNNTNLNDEQKERLRGALESRKELPALLEKWQAEDQVYEYLQQLVNDHDPEETETAETETDAAVEPGSTSREGLFRTNDDDAASDKSGGRNPLKPNILGDYDAEGQGPSADQDSGFDVEKLTANTLQLKLSDTEPTPFPVHTREKKPSRVSQRIVSWLRYHQSLNNETKTNEHQSEVLARLLDPSVSRSSRLKLLSGRFLKVGQAPLSKVIKGLEHSEGSKNESVLTVNLRRDWRLNDTKKSGAFSDPHDIWVDDPLAKAWITKVITDISGRQGGITAKGIETQFIDSLASLHSTGYTLKGVDEYVASQPENPFDPSKEQWWLIDLTTTADKARSKNPGRGSASLTRRIAFTVSPGSDWDPTKAGSGLKGLHKDDLLRHDVKQELERQNRPVPDYLKDAQPTLGDDILLSYLARSS